MSNTPTEETTNYTKITTYLSYDGKISSVHIGHYKTANRLIDSLNEGDLQMKSIHFSFFKTEVKSYGIYSQSVQLNTIFGDARLELQNSHKHFCPESVVVSEQIGG
jgi:hypothetical protein